MAKSSSDMDVKHDTQKSAKGLRGGGLAVKGMGASLSKGGSVMRYAEGGSVCRAGGGMVTPGGKGRAKRSKSCKVC